MQRGEDESKKLAFHWITEQRLQITSWNRESICVVAMNELFMNIRIVNFKRGNGFLLTAWKIVKSCVS